MKHYNKILIIILALFVSAFVAWKYLSYVQNEREELSELKYQTEAQDMKKRLQSMILAKQKATVAMALSLEYNEQLANNILKYKITPNYFDDLIENFKSDTLYKNIWIQVLDKDLRSVYRSWTDKKGDTLGSVRKDLLSVMKHKSPIFSISVGRFDLSLKAIVPILKKNEVVGIIEVISHFNSISKLMKEFNVESVVVLNKEYKQQLKHPFTNIFIDEYYIANLDAPQKLRELMKENSVDTYFSDTHMIRDGYLSVAYPLKSISGKTLGHYVMFKKLEDISSADLDFFIFKLFAIAALILILVGAVVVTIMYYLLHNQKNYFKKIIDTSTNIVLINDGNKIMSVNKMFFRYFYTYRNIEHFRSEVECICNMFVCENGYLQKEMDGEDWLSYVVNHPNINHKIKINYEGQAYYFQLGVSLVSEESGHYSVVLSDTTNEEKYKIELEQLTITDPLTDIGNRRHFDLKLHEEISRAKRYKHELSLVMFDIDHFKKVNDTHGHIVGDKVLQEYTKLLSSMLRELDTFARVGGEEFIVILPHTNLEQAFDLAQKLRKEVEESTLILPITMSFGVSEFLVEDTEATLVARVDEALYEAKNSGRNRVIKK